MSAELRQVADGCAYRVRSFTNYDVNGYLFHTTSHEHSQPNRRTTNTGVFTQGLDGVEYYGRIEEIYKLMFHGRKHYPRSGHHCRFKNPLHYRILNRQWHTGSDGGLTSLPVLKNQH